MATGPTTSTTLDDLEQRVMAELARQVQEASAFMPGSPGFKYLRVKDLSGTKANTGYFPTLSTLTAATLSEDTDLGDSDWQTIESAANSISSVCKGNPVFITDDSLGAADLDMFSEFTYMNALSLAKSLDGDLCALFDGFTQTSGSSGGNLTLAHLLEANRLLDAAEAPMARVCVIHGDQWSQLLHESNSMFVNVATSGSIAESVLRSYRVFTDPILGWEWIVTPRVQDGSSYTTDWVGGVFAYGALGEAWKQLPTVETQRDISRGGGGFEWIGKMRVGVGELTDLYGVGLVSKKGTPA